MQLQTAARRNVKIKMSISSPTGFGKTTSALLIAFGITNDWSKIAIIDTENESASLYAKHSLSDGMFIGEFQTIPLKPPYSAQRYIDAIKICEGAGIEVIIIDSVTHVWQGQGGVLEYQNKLGGRYQDWMKATPIYQRWLDAILQSPAHIISTIRKKQAYNVVQDGQKTRVEKAGLDDQIRDGFDYEQTIALEIINDTHMARAAKDRTGLFSDKPEFVITVETGKKILDWCNQGLPALLNDNEFVNSINACTTYQQLLALYANNPDKQASYASHFNRRKKEVTPKAAETNLSTNNFSSNGSTTVKQ